MSKFWFWKNKSFRLFVVILAILVSIISLLLLISLGYQVDWTGFNRHVENISSGQQDQPAKTLWDWLQLLIIPVVLAIGGFLLNITTSRSDQKIAAKRYEADQKIALDKQREDLLQSYLDRMAELLLEKDLRTSKEDAEVRNVARVRTLTVIGQLNTTRQNVVLSFLREAKLAVADPEKSIVTLHNTVLSSANFQGVNFSDIDLSGANLSGANLSGANLSGANLSGANLSGANLSKAILTNTNLSEANLREAVFIEAVLIHANLSRANLRSANLRKVILHETKLQGANLDSIKLQEANLSGINLSGINLREANLCMTEFYKVNLSGADLSEANLSGADLSEANLSGADLSEANISGVKIDQALGITQAQLSQTRANRTQS
ncbi:pentapeptide repeat-containing protein [Dictyobacter alpinus]|nr:pentapeptide repeat-containing protein [Dictyobacter alpinus]